MVIWILIAGMILGLVIMFIGAWNVIDATFYTGLIAVAFAIFGMVLVGIDQGGKLTQERVEQCQESNGIPSQVSGTFICTHLVDK